MQKTLIISLLLSILMISGCMDAMKLEDTPTDTNGIEVSDALTGEVSVSSGVQITGTVNADIEIIDIVGTTIPQGKDIGLYLSEYLSGIGLADYIIAKTLAKDDVITVSMTYKESGGSYCQFEGGSCITFIIKNKTIVRTNLENFLGCNINNNNNECASLKLGGLVYRYTKDGVLLDAHDGEGLPCFGGTQYKFIYVNLQNLKEFYATLDVSYTGVSPDPKDDLCNNKDTKRTRLEVLLFYKSLEDQIKNNPLNLKAKTTEEAFYEYYNKK